jgi:uncharacterized protein
MKFGLTKSEINIVIDYLTQYPELNKIVVFGSRGRGNQQLFSDIDICLFATSHVPIVSIKNDLNQLRIPYLFDVVEWEDALSEKFKERIIRDGKIMWQSHKKILQKPRL